MTTGRSRAADDWLGIARRVDVAFDARFSTCRRFRYKLDRIWNKRRGGCVLFVGLNPSTADARRDDPTIRRMARFAFDWGFGGMTVCNLFALRATDPRQLKRAVDPIGPANNAILAREVRQAALVVACWGNHGTLRGRAGEAIELLTRQAPSLFCLSTTRSGQPKHPLYLSRETRPVRLGSR